MVSFRKHSGEDAVFRISDGRLMEGFIPPKKAKIIQDWISKRNDELEALWKGLNQINVTITLFKIEP